MNEQLSHLKNKTGQNQGGFFLKKLWVGAWGAGTIN